MTELNDNLEPRYDLPFAAIDQLTQELIDRHTHEVPVRYRYAAVEVKGDSPYANIARYIEGTVFQAAFGNTPEQMKREYGPYETTSTFFISLDRGADGSVLDLKKATGALRVINNSDQGLKTLNDIESEPFYVDLDSVVYRHGIEDMNKTWDIGTVAVLPEYRKGEGPVSVQLYRAMYLAAMHGNIEHLVSVIDGRALTKLTGYLGIPFVPLADSEPHPYLGSQSSTAVYGHVPEFFAKMSRHRLTPRGILAHKALARLVKGTEDDSIVLAHSS